MMRALPTGICGLAAVFACLAAGARDVETDSAASSGPYQAIVERNVFSLKPPPPPAPDPSTLEPPKPPMPPITLNGIADLTGRKVAMLKIVMPATAAAAGKPAEGPKEKSFMLGAEERDGEVEVLKIDMAEKSVVVSVFGTVTNLNFDKNGPRLASPAPAAGAAPGGAVNPHAAAAAAMGSRSIPTARPVRMSGVGPSYSNLGGSGALPAGYSSAGGTPAPGASTPGVSNPAAEGTQTLTSEQSILAMEIERERTKDLVAKGLMPPIPPTVLSEASRAAEQSQQQPAANNQQEQTPFQNLPGRPPGFSFPPR